MEMRHARLDESGEDDDARLVVKMAIAPADNILDVDLVDSFL